MGYKIWIPPSRDNVWEKPKPLLDLKRAAPLGDAASTARHPMREGGTALAGSRSESPGLPIALQVCCCDIQNSRAGHSFGEDNPIPVYTEEALWPQPRGQSPTSNSPNAGTDTCQSMAQM